ncbi:alpha-glucosidase [Lactiplantibacillus sp. WILCCON 0030]|uniref:Alpha-glucosidase n=1 Tax=Lactiplantibacillus brownii TaxID=3069269 RepID=A0ABU1ACP3_9LACO|nr:alpha-glucosidase [Lactiplantibacillus brownii]MDQ7938698.1 alpha-glucosidase [Lactiplantibacillus brownii]
MSQPWWQSAVVYQIYPRSFQDSNGDGIGDLPGIISRLDYLQELGVDALWLSPVYQSPNADNGYDISDYQAINPEYGTMADMDRLIAAAKARGIRIVMDLVVNHTSDEHAWFVEAKANPDSPTRDYYVWSDPVDGQAPNDLTSGFIGGSAWEFDEPSGQYFLHLFSAKQIDLNWQNPQLRQAIYAMMNFWIDKGIGGFRMDVIDMIGKEPFKKQLVNGPYLHDYLHEMNRQTWGDRDFLTVGEAWSAGPKDALQYSDPANQELSMIFQFGHLWADRQVGGEKWETTPLSVSRLKQALYDCQQIVGPKGWNSLFWNNHDLPRAVSRFGSSTGLNRVLSAKMLAITLHGLKGTPYIYQGEELGMTDCPVTTIDQVDDVEARTIYRQLRAKGDTEMTAMAKINRFSRDNARTPMQWDASFNAGFSTGQPWLAVNPNYDQINAATALAEPASIFRTYQRLIALRQTNPVLQMGVFAAIDAVPENVLAYTRTLNDVTWLICSNFSAEPTAVALPTCTVEVLVSNYAAVSEQLGPMKLRPYEAFMVALK